MFYVEKLVQLIINIKFSCNCTLSDFIQLLLYFALTCQPDCQLQRHRCQLQDSTSELQLVVCRRSVRRKDRHCPDVCGSGIRPSGMSGCRACRSALVCDEVARERPAKCCFGMSTVYTAAKLIYLLSCLYSVFSDH